MTVGIIAANNIRYSPYIFFYTNLMDEIGVEYELIYPNRMNIEDSYAGTSYIIPWNKKVNTVFAYYDFTRKAKEIIQKKRYDLLIVLTTNNAVYMAHWLKRSYNKRYILDIRDYTHENISIYYSLEKVAVRNSLLNVISSIKFKEFLPSGEYVVCHNTSGNKDLYAPKLKHNSTLTIGYIGKGSYLEQCKKICDKVCVDRRFIFAFYGLRTVPDSLKSYEKYDNIRFNGIFSPEEKETIILNTDILFNVYGNGIPLLDYALSNKLYDAFIYGKPILTSPNTFMSEMAGPFAFDMDFTSDSFLDDLYNWYNELNEQDLMLYAQEKYKQILDEGKHAEQSIRQAILQSLN